MNSFAQERSSLDTFPTTRDETAVLWEGGRYFPQAGGNLGIQLIVSAEHLSCQRKSKVLCIFWDIHQMYCSMPSSKLLVWCTGSKVYLQSMLISNKIKKVIGLMFIRFVFQSSNALMLNNLRMGPPSTLWVGKERGIRSWRSCWKKKNAIWCQVVRLAVYKL